MTATIRATAPLTIWPGRHGEQADGQGDYREGRTGEAWGVGAVVERSAGVLTSGTDMVNRGVLHNPTSSLVENYCVPALFALHTVVAGSADRCNETAPMSRNTIQAYPSVRGPNERPAVSAVPGLGMPGT